MHSSATKPDAAHTSGDTGEMGLAARVPIEHVQGREKKGRAGALSGLLGLKGEGDGRGSGKKLNRKAPRNCSSGRSVAPASVESKAEQHQETRTAWTLPQIGSSYCGLEAQQMFACSRNTARSDCHPPVTRHKLTDRQRTTERRIAWQFTLARGLLQMAICTSRCIVVFFDDVQPQRISSSKTWLRRGAWTGRFF